MPMRKRTTTSGRIAVGFFVTLLLGLSSAGRAKPPVTEGETDATVADFSALFIDRLGREKQGDAMKVADLTGTERYQNLMEKHQLKLLGGPMLGRITGSAATVWLRTTEPAAVKVVAEPESGAEASITATGRSRAEEDLTARPRLRGLAPTTAYRYNVFVDGQPVYPADERPILTTYPERGEPGRFDVAFGACSRYIPENESIWRTIAGRDPVAFLTLGDNVYIDQPERPDVQRLHYYRRQMRGDYRALTASAGVYAIWDDHDFGDNDVAGGPAVDEPAWKREALKVFKENWANPAYGGGSERPGCWFDFHIGDVHFIMTDGRYYRDFEKGTMLGPAQKAWLLQTLRESDATFKVIASGTLWTRHADKGGGDSWWGVKEEREEIFRFLAEQDAEGVVLISGDRHRADVYKMDWPGAYPLYEFENAKLTNWHTHETRDKALFSHNKGHFFGLLSFDTEASDPALTYRIIGRDNRTIYEKTLHLSELSP